MLTLDDIARQPERAAELTESERNRLTLQCASVLVALAACADESSAGKGERLLTVPEVAERLGYASSRIYEVIRQGDLPAMRHGKYIRIRAEAVEAFIAAHERETPVDRSVRTVFTSGNDRERSETNPARPQTLAGGARETPRRPQNDGVAVGAGRGNHHQPGGAGPEDASRS